jgi:hypothetical protein
MSSVESFDGLCGIIHQYADSDKQVRCLYEFGHHGPCSWKEIKGLTLHFGSCCNSSARDPETQFVNSVMVSIQENMGPVTKPSLWKK